MALDKSRLATTNPETTVEGGGLPTGFLGTVVGATYRVRQNDAGRKWLSAEFRVMPDEGSDVDPRFLEGGVEARWSAGALTAFAPSKDGEEVVPWESWGGDEANADEVSGPYALRVGTSAGLRKSVNWVVFNDRARETGDPHVAKLTKESVDIRDWVGVHGRWDRLPQPERDFRDGSGKQAGDMLCLTQVVPAGAGAAKVARGAGAGASKRANGAVAGSNGGADAAALDETLQALVMGVLSDVSGPIHKLKLTPALQQLEDEGQRKAGMKRIVAPAFLEAGAQAGLWQYHAENGTVQSAE